MPGPVVYVAVAISAVAAVIVFKEFVYDPHLRPKWSAWKEGRRRRPHLHTASTSSSSSSGGGGENQLSPQRSTRDKKNPSKRPAESSVTPHNDLHRLIVSDVESLKSGVEPDGDNAGFRQRRVGESQKRRNRPSGNLARTSGTSSTPSLISLDDLGTPGEFPTSGPRPEPLKPSSPLSASTGTLVESSTQAVQQGDGVKSGSTPHPRSPNSQTPVVVGIPHVLEASQVPGPANSFALMALGEPETTRSSSPDTEFLSPSDILSGDQYLTPYDQTLTPQRFHGTSSPTLSSNLSAEFISSAPLSPPGSPFVDAGMYFELAETRRGNPAAPQSEIPSGAGQLSSGLAEGTPPGAILRATVRGDAEIFSLSSQLSSDMSSDEGDYDSASFLGSELSNWTSDVADGERATG